MTEQNTVSSLPLFDVERRRDDVSAPQTVKSEDVVVCTRIQNMPEEPPAGTQCDRVLEYLTTHNSITPMDALRHLGIMRLGARIWDLKRMGHNIDTGTEEVMTGNGGTARVARYTLRRTA